MFRRKIVGHIVVERHWIKSGMVEVQNLLELLDSGAELLQKWEPSGK
jgi:hypothetical protein